MNQRIGMLALGMILLFASAAQAQINGPPPTLQFRPSMHAWSVPGVVSSTDLATLFSCTNTLTIPVIVGIELFGPAGGAALNDADATSFEVAPGGSVVFSTQFLTSFSFDRNLATYVTGAARVLTTTSFFESQRILCGAFVSDILTAVPSATFSLNVIRGMVQMGQ